MEQKTNDTNFKYIKYYLLINTARGIEIDLNVYTLYLKCIDFWLYQNQKIKYPWIPISPFSPFSPVFPISPEFPVSPFSPSIKRLSSILWKKKKNHQLLIFTGISFRSFRSQFSGRTVAALEKKQHLLKLYYYKHYR